MTMEIHYGKAAVAVYRTHGTPLTGIRPIPESTFAGRSNVLLAAELDVRVMGSAFASAYIDGDNRLVVATDTMKNFIHAASLEFAGSTLEEWLFFVGRRFLDTYPHMERLRMSGRTLPFEPALVPVRDGAGSGAGAGAGDGAEAGVAEDAGGSFAASAVLFGRDRNDAGTAWLELARGDHGAIQTTDHACGRIGLQLIKVTGSSFRDFARDEHTTLPERIDRPLYIHVDVGWRYADPADALDPSHLRYVPSEQVGDLCAAVFEEFVSLSIQHLVHEMGQRMLARFPQLVEVSFEAQNRLWDHVATSPTDERIKTYCDPRPPYGRIGLVLHRD